MITEVFPNHEAMSHAAAAWLEKRIHEKPSALLCLATGATPMRAYELLATRPKSIFAQTRILKLDEWGGIPMESPATCETFLRRTIVTPLEIGARYSGFHSQNDPQDECERIDSWLYENGPIDVCVLGIGLNGHLAFNEPADALQPHSHVAKLSAESMAHSMVASLPQKPTYGLTLGIADLLESREILLVVSGAAKAAVVKRLGVPRITPQFPASFLWLHPRVTILCDEDAYRSARA